MCRSPFWPLLVSVFLGLGKIKENNFQIVFYLVLTYGTFTSLSFQKNPKNTFVKNDPFNAREFYVTLKK